MECYELMKAYDHDIHPSFGMVNKFTGPSGCKEVAHVDQVEEERHAVREGQHRQQDVGGGLHLLP